MSLGPSTPDVGQPGLARVARLTAVSSRYGQTRALDAVTLDFPAGRMIGLIGPDGVGKSSMLSLIAGARKIQDGQVEVLGGDMRDATHRRRVCPRIAYMPQGLGKNLYPTLSVFENADFFGQLFGQGRAERKRRITSLLESTSMARFTDRPAGKLSGGMKQKLSLCCSLIHDPDLLILDEPTTGVDPLSRRQFWELIDRIRADRPGMSVLVATAYMDEAARFDWLVAMDEGKVLAMGTTKELLARTNSDSLDAAFIALLPEAKRQGHTEVIIPPRAASGGEVAIEAKNLTRRFGDFVAVNQVNFRIERGEIFGFLGSNGSGKSTTMKMLCGLLPISEGEAFLFGQKVDAEDLATRQRVGYMSQNFSLYSELTVRQNLVLHAQLFHVPETELDDRVRQSASRFGLDPVMDALPESLPLGQKQRLQLAVALIHQPELLILDEPTSGVDPVARDSFWQELVALSRKDRVTIFVSTHFMNEAQRCDRISLMHAGRVLVSDTPTDLVKKRGSASLEDAFISYLEEASAATDPPPQKTAAQVAPGDTIQGAAAARATAPAAAQDAPPASPWVLRARRLLSYAKREVLDLSRDPIRLTLAGLGSVILMFIMGYGITLDVENLTFAVLDRSQTTASEEYVLNWSGSRYFLEQPPITDYEDLDRRMRAGEITMALEIPPEFGRDLGRGKPVQIGVWIDGAMPARAETIRGYVQGIHAKILEEAARRTQGSTPSPATIELRFRYNPDVRSLVAIVPAVIPLLLLLIPAMLATLSVVSEKEIGSIVNFYVTPTTRLEFLIGKQVPYVIIGMINFLLLTLLAVTVFEVPLTGSFWTLAAAALLYVTCATAMGLLISTFTSSQVAAIFGTAVFTLVPAAQFCGIIDPVSSLEGAGRLIGSIYPTTYFLTISRGTFSKALGFAELYRDFIPLLIAVPVLVGLSAALLRKQET